MIGNIQYRYAGKKKEWNWNDYDTMTTKDCDICFFLYDSEGNELKSSGGGSGRIPSDDGTFATQRWHYSKSDLPDTLIVKAKDVFEKKEYGTIEVHLAKSNFQTRSGKYHIQKWV